MSGGHFEYEQYRLRDMSDEIQSIIDKNGKINEELGTVTYDYDEEVIDKFRETIKTCQLAEAMLQRVDWLVSGDDGTESFHRRWEKEVTPLKP